MKKEINKQNRIWLWLLVSVLALALCAFGVLTLFGPGRQEATDATYKFYWNVDREFYTATSETGLSTREKADDDLFHVRFANENGIIELTTEDKKLVNLIDLLPVVAVKADGSAITDVQDPTALGYVINRDVYVASAEAGLITANTSVAMNGMKIYINVTENVKIIRACGTDEQMGKKLAATDLMCMDLIYTIADADGNYLYTYLAERVDASNPYWRAEAMYSSTTKETTRVPDENGVYTVDFFLDGERVSLKCKDKELVTKIDRTDRYLSHFALVFDEEGYIIGTQSSALALKAVPGCSNYIVAEINGNSFTAEGAGGTTNADKIYDGRIGEDCVFIDVSLTAESEGRQGQKVDGLKVGDRIICFTDVNGEAKYIFVIGRMADVPIYFNMVRAYSSKTGETTREPNSKGYYEIEVLKIGTNKPITVKTKDKALVTYIDKRADRTFGLRVENGIVLAAYQCESLFGRTNYALRYVSEINGAIVSAMLYKTPTDVVNMLINPGVPVYDVSGCGKLGAQTKIRIGDLVVAHRNGKNDIVCVFVIKRNMGLDHAYWVLNRQYDKEKGVSTRVPNEDGYYVFDMAYKGKLLTVKTRSKSVADYIDSQNVGVGLTVKNGIVQYAYDPVNTTGAVKVGAVTITEIDKNGIVSVGSSQFQLAKNCKFINCAEAFTSYKGEYVKSLKVGDTIVGYLDMYGEAKVVYIIARDADKMYWNIAPYAKLEPDAKGYYNFQLAVDGKVKQMKTKNKELADRINNQLHAFALVTKGDEFFSYVTPIRAKNVKERAGANWTVIKISGSKVTLRYDVPGSKEFTGDKKTLTMNKNCRVYDVTLDAKNPGGKTTLQVGDRVEAYTNDDDQLLYCYVLAHNNHQVAANYKCPHCNKVVHWEPYISGHLTGKSGHYYLSGNLNKDTVLLYGTSAGEDTELVLDLNGKTITTTGQRAIAVYSGEKLHIVDSVGTGTIQATGVTGKNGTALQISDGGHVELWSGTLKMLESDQQVRIGGVVYMYGDSSTFTMRGGKLTGGKVVKIDGRNSIGGAIYSDDAAVTILGGEIDGTSEYQGGAIYATAPLHIENATITGNATDSADAIYCAGNLTIKNSTIHGEVRHNTAGKTVLIANSTLSYLRLSAADANTTFTGKVVINDLNLNSGAKVTLKDLAAGTSIKFRGNGVLTTANEKMAQWLAAGYFVADGGKELVVTDGVLQYKTVNANEAECPHCGQTVLWQAWDFSAQTSGHFFVPENLPAVSATCIVPADKNLVIDLRGQTINVTAARALTINGKMSILDTVGGGLITGDQTGNGGVLSIQAGGELELLGGTYRSMAGKGANKGTVAYVVSGGKLIVDGTAVLDGSNITEGNKATADYSTIYANGAVEIKGGEIKGVKNAPRGGSIFVNTGSLAVSGGTIGGGTAALGADIYCTNATSDIAFTGGTVSGQVEMSATQSLTISGKPVLNNLKVTSASKITLGELEEGALIAIAGAGDVSFPNANAKTYLEKGYVKAYAATDSLKVTDRGVLYIPFCPHCSLPVNTSTIQWQPWDYNTQTAGHYYLTDDLLTKSGQFSIESDYIVLDLRGHSIHVTDNRVFEVTSNLTIIDTVGGGTITGTLATTEKGGVFYVKSDATLNLYGGTFRATSAVLGAVVYGETKSTVNIGSSAVVDGSPINTGSGAYGAIFSSGNLNITSGEIIGGSVGSGGSIYQEGGTLSISGGYIHGGTASNMGHDIFATSSCTLTISGGEVEKQIRINSVTTATVSGAPKLGAVKTTAGVRLTLGKLLPGADITMAVEGAFTVENDNAAEYLKYFHANASTKYIYEDAGVLYMTTKPTE